MNNKNSSLVLCYTGEVKQKVSSPPIRLKFEYIYMSVCVRLYKYLSMQDSPHRLSHEKIVHLPFFTFSIDWSSHAGDIDHRTERLDVLLSCSLNRRIFHSFSLSFIYLFIFYTDICNSSVYDAHQTSLVCSHIKKDENFFLRHIVMRDKITCFLALPVDIYM
jgi:hypothetical protein